MKSTESGIWIGFVFKQLKKGIYREHRRLAHRLGAAGLEVKH